MKESFPLSSKTSTPSPRLEVISLNFSSLSLSSSSACLRFPTISLKARPNWPISSSPTTLVLASRLPLPKALTPFKSSKSGFVMAAEKITAAMLPKTRTAAIIYMISLMISFTPFLSGPSEIPRCTTPILPFKRGTAMSWMRRFSLSRS